MILESKTVEIAGTTAFHCSLIDDMGVVVSKLISYNNYITMLSKNSVEKTNVVFTDIGKEDKFHLLKCQVGNVPGYFKVLIEVPAQKRPFVHFENGHFTPYPRLLFFLQAEDNVISGQVYAVKGKRKITDRTKLYRYPFGNVSEYGSICMGNISRRLTNLPVIEQSEDYISKFFSGTTNDDYYTIGGSIKKHMKQYELLTYLDSLQVFPETLLAPSKTTINDLI